MNARGWRVSVIALGALALGASAWAKDKDKMEDPTEDIGRAKTTMESFKANDPGLEIHLKGAAGYAVFPSVGKGGLVVGAASGKGILFEKGMATGFTKLTQVSVGALAGGQSYAEVIIFKDPSALNDFKRGQFAVASDASAVAGGAGASQSLKYSKGVAVMTMAKGGLMAEASVGGQKFSFREFEHPVAPIPKT